MSTLCSHYLLRMCAGALLASMVTTGHAIVIEFNPPSQTIVADQGTPVSFDLVARDVVDDVATIANEGAIGAYDISLAVLGAQTLTLEGVEQPVVFGNGLDVSGLGGVSGFEVTGSTISLFEVSLDAPDVLQVQQADTFTLATLNFSVGSSGHSSVVVSPLSALADAFGNSIEFARGVAHFSEVGEPTPLLLLSVGLSLLVFGRGTGAVC